DSERRPLGITALLPAPGSMPVIFPGTRRPGSAQARRARGAPLAAAASTEQRYDRSERGAEGQRAAPIEEHLHVALHAPRNQKEDAGPALGVDLIRDERPDDRLLDVDVPGEDRSGAALGEVHLAGHGCADPTELDRDAIAPRQADPALRDGDVGRPDPPDPALVHV